MPGPLLNLWYIHATSPQSEDRHKSPCISKTSTSALCCDVYTNLPPKAVNFTNFRPLSEEVWKKIIRRFAHLTIEKKTRRPQHFADSKSLPPRELPSSYRKPNRPPHKATWNKERGLNVRHKSSKEGHLTAERMAAMLSIFCCLGLWFLPKNKPKGLSGSKSTAKARGDNIKYVWIWCKINMTNCIDVELSRYRNVT